MAPNYNDLIKRIEELEAWKAQKERQQLSFPLDNASLGVLNQAFYTYEFDQFRVRDVFFTVTTSGTTTQGQLRYFNDGVSQNFRAQAGSFTGTVDLTAV